MKSFKHINATSVEEAVSELNQYGGKAAVIAGGTDILGAMKDMILPENPEALVNIKTIPGLDYIKEEGGMLKIGALTKLQDIAESDIVKSKYPAIAESADLVASPPLRAMGTLGGNLCQENRCWYYRSSFNKFFCFRKGGTLCFATIGDNTNNAILGGQVCFAICPSDTAISLSALDATIVTSRRSIPISNFYQVLGNNLDADEIVTEVQVPEPVAGTTQKFIKFRVRKAIDFAVVSVAAVITTSGGNVTDARIVLGGVAPVPYRVKDAENEIKEKAINESVAEAAGNAAVNDAFALTDNKYKVQLVKVLVKRAVLS